MDLYSTLACRREELGISKLELSKHLKIPTSDITLAENQFPKAHTLDKVVAWAKYLDLDIVIDETRLHMDWLKHRNMMLTAEIMDRICAQLRESPLSKAHLRSISRAAAHKIGNAIDENEDVNDAISHVRSVDVKAMTSELLALRRKES